MAATSARVYDERDRDDHDPPDTLMHDVDLPRGESFMPLIDPPTIDRAYGAACAAAARLLHRTAPIPVDDFVRARVREYAEREDTNASPTFGSLADKLRDALKK